MTDWNTRYQQGEHLRDEPHTLVVNFASMFGPGRALDIACGPGRHAIWLAEHGWAVTAVDSSPTAIDILHDRARQKGLAVNCFVADLETHEFVIERQSYDLIVVCNYLQRDLFPSIRSGIRAGGGVIAVVALVDADPELKPMNPDFLVAPGELRAEFDGWELIHDFEGKRKLHSRAAAELVARRPIGDLHRTRFQIAVNLATASNF